MTDASDDIPKSGTVAGIGIHPVKSLRGLEPRSWPFERLGPWLDRRWMLIEGATGPGRFLSLRKDPDLARCRIELSSASPAPEAALPILNLTWDDQSFTVSPRRETPDDHDQAELWGNQRVVLDEGPEAAAWFSRKLGRPVRLVRHLPDRDPWRSSDPPAEGATTGLSDGYPVLVVAASTIEAAVGDAWSPRRFRANIVVAGVPPHAEDRWRRIRIGDLVLDLVKPCVRCVATTVDPKTGIRSGDEPLRTLTRTRAWTGRPVLGWNALVRVPGTVEIGSAVEVESWRSEAEQPVQTSPLGPDGGPPGAA